MFGSNPIKQTNSYKINKISEIYRCRKESRQKDNPQQKFPSENKLLKLPGIFSKEI